MEKPLTSFPSTSSGRFFGNVMSWVFVLPASSDEIMLDQLSEYSGVDENTLAALLGLTFYWLEIQKEGFMRWREWYFNILPKHSKVKRW